MVWVGAPTSSSAGRRLAGNATGISASHGRHRCPRGNWRHLRLSKAPHIEGRTLQDRLRNGKCENLPDVYIISAEPPAPSGPAPASIARTRNYLSSTMSFNTAANKLRQAIEHGTDIIVAPGVHDGFSARIAQSVGFDCLYMVRLLLLTPPPISSSPHPSPSPSPSPPSSTPLTLPHRPAPAPPPPASATPT